MVNSDDLWWLFKGICVCLQGIEIELRKTSTHKFQIYAQVFCLAKYFSFPKRKNGLICDLLNEARIHAR